MVRHNDKRSAMTLIELLVVLGILTLLVALVMAGVSAVRGRQQASLTEATIEKLQLGIDNQVKALNDQARKDRKDRTRDYQLLRDYCGDEDRAEALLMYMKIRHAFPQTFAEAKATMMLVTAGGTIQWQPHKAYASFTSASGGSDDEQSAALLYAGLSGMATSGSEFATDDATASAQIDMPNMTVGGHAARVFKDGWNRPIGFKRFFQSGELNAPPYTNAKDSNFDPFDTQSKLSGWADAVKKGTAQSLVGAAFDRNNKVITAFSIGENKTYESLAGDDIAGFRLRKIGGRGTQ